MEEWRLVPSVPGLEASSLGRLRVMPYIAEMPNGGCRSYGGTASYGVWDGARFIYRLRGNTYRVAPLVCEAFHGARPDGLVCLHADEDARNNRPTNLSWGTQRENLNAPGFIEHCKARTGNKNPFTKSRIWMNESTAKGATQ